jgi:hypothetical protein
MTEAAAALGITVDRFAWTGPVARSGLSRNAAYLIRPDGHVALASPDQDAEMLRAYAARIGLVARPESRISTSAREPLAGSP